MMLEQGYWWEADKGECHRAVVETIQRLDTDQGYRRHANFLHMALYSRRQAAHAFNRSLDVPDGGRRLKINICSALVDAALAHHGSKRPKPFVLPEKANAEMRDRAANLQRFLSGQFYSMRLYETLQKVYLHALIYGTGFLHIYHDGFGGLCAEAVDPNEVIIDDAEAKDGSPRSMYWVRDVAREVALALPYAKKFRAQIEQSGRIRMDDEADYAPSVANLVSIAQAVHLPSSPKAKDGRRAIVVENATLLDDEAESFELIPFRYKEPPTGFYGIGLIENIKSMQLWLNQVLEKIEEAAHFAAPFFVTQKGAGARRLTNRPWTQYESAGPVQVVNPPGIHPQFLELMDRIIARAYEQEGINQLTASGQVPANLESGEAIKTHDDIGSKRFQAVGQRWEQFCSVHVTERILEVAEEIEESGAGNLEVLAMGDRDVEKLSFREVRMKRNDYAVKVWPTSLLPDRPEGKIDTIERLAKVFPSVQQDLMSLLDMPDLDAVRERLLAGHKLTEHQIERMLKYGEPQTPMPIANLAMARELATQHLLMAYTDNVEQGRVQLLEQYLEMVDALAERAQMIEQGMNPGPGAMAAPPAGAPSGAGAAAGPAGPGVPPV